MSKSASITRETALVGKPITAGRHFFTLKTAAAGYSDFDRRHRMTYPGGLKNIHNTIAAAVTNVTASQNDTIHVLEGHTETFTAALTLSKAGMTVKGYGHGQLRPQLQGNGTIDCVDITANNVKFENFYFNSPDTDAQTACINVSGVDGVVISDIYGIGSETSNNVVDMITVVASSDDLLIEKVQFYNSVVAVNSFISLEGASARVTLKDIWCYGDVVASGIIDGGLITHLFMENVRVGVVGTTKPAITLDSNPTGLARNCFFSGTHTTLATNADLGNAMRLDNIKVLEETNNSASAAIIPAVDSD